ncbi:MAG: hypothetical protein IJZ42_01155 [Lachnospiraceae bacterium]|nr:hypothetical protein [Lachnospiraceae bacterium]
MEDKDQIRSGIISLVTLVVIILVVIGCASQQKYVHTDQYGKIRYVPIWAHTDQYGNYYVPISEEVMSCVPDIEHTEKEVEHEILLIRAYVNWSEGFNFHGSFMDKEGNVYLFDFSNYENVWSVPEVEDNATFVRALEEIRKTAKPKTTVDAQVVNEVRETGCKIDQTAELYEIKDWRGADMGDDYIVFCNPKTKEFVFLETFGDYSYRLEEKHAKKLAEMYRELCNERQIY